MEFDEYIFEARKTAVYPKDKALEYLALGLCSEAGEVAGKIKKQILGGWVNGVPQELGDVLWYFAMLLDEYGCTFEEIAHGNLRKLADRAERDVIVGEGDER